MNKNKHKKVVLVTGGFDPIHSGHLAYLKEAKTLAEFLVVGVNSNKWLSRKKDNFFMSWDERANVIANFSFVDMVIDFDDSDDTASDAIKKCLQFSDEVIFANGGDRIKNEIPETKKYIKNSRVKFVYGVGGNTKLNSSSWILDEYINKNIQIDKRHKNNNLVYEKKAPWGSHSTIAFGSMYKVKEITINPGKQISLQFHKKRQEHWIIVKGIAEVTINDDVSKKGINDYIFIEKKQKHRIKNYGKKICKLIEVSTGDYLEDDDIVRLDDDFSRV